MVQDIARMLLDTGLSDQDAYDLVGEFLSSCEDTDGNLHINTNKITADTITVGTQK